MSRDGAYQKSKIDRARSLIPLAHDELRAQEIEINLNEFTRMIVNKKNSRFHFENKNPRSAENGETRS